jgi:ABC-type Zn uptake system ZnuABC Zn-binding protein ZnuA
MNAGGRRTPGGPRASRRPAGAASRRPAGAASRRPARAVTPAFVAVALAVLVSGCGAGARADGRLQVVATTTQVADLARNVAGNAADVTQVLAPNADPHEYELRPHDVRAVADARVVLRSGGDVDGWLTPAISASGTTAPVIDLVDHVDQRRQGGDLDPHWWQDPRNAEQAVATIETALERADPNQAAGYRANAARYTQRLQGLDHAVAACMDRIPAAKRRLVTTHDALGYYARRYGIAVIGTVIPSLSSAGQPSAGEIATLVDTIRKQHVTTVFAESSVNPKVEGAIASQANAHVGPPLWADALGPKGSTGATYIGSIVANTRALAAGFDPAVRCTV